MPRYESAPELVVMTRPDAGLRVRRGERAGFASAVADVSPLANLLGALPLTPLFGSSEDRVIARAASVAAATGMPVPDLSVFYRVEAPPARMDELAAQLREQPVIAAAYVKPPAEPAQAEILNDMAPSLVDAPPATPDFTASQIYLGAAPAGIEALWAHTRPGGTGANVRIIDVEGAWRFSHEDLGQVQGGVVGGVPINSLGWRNHGTAVIGVFGGDENPFGVKGISPAANTRAISIFTNATGTAANSSKAIKDAADLLSAGDIILIELHRPGPRHNFQQRDDQLGYIAVEWWEDDFQAILYATAKGVIVVEAAGNGAENLDDQIYGVRPAGFPVSWTNPFNRANRDAGAVLVGAGAPPPGTHGADHGPDRSRLGFSNYGNSLDVQGWGREVTTTGYGDLQGGTSEDEWYTEHFSGTSSSSPVVVGAVACMQGNRKATGQPVYTPAQVRQKLRTTGSPQQDAPGRPATQRIGNRPNLRQLIGGIKVTKEIIKEGKEVKIEKVEKAEKAEKVEFKEKTEKIEKREAKEFKVEKVEIKEFDKHLIEGFELQSGAPAQGAGPAPGASVEERLAALEQSMGIPAPAPVQPLICTTFGSMPIGFGPNPRPGVQASFLVRQFNGLPAPQSRIVSWGGFRGLDCGFICEVTLGSLASSVVLSLVHFSQPGTIQAFNSANVLVASAVMNPAQAVVQTFTLNGAGIRRVVIRCPADETLLLRFCFRPGKLKLEKLEKIEIKEIKEIEIGPVPEGTTGVEGFDPAGGEYGHFIDPSMRPDLTAGALGGEPDVTGAAAGLSRKLAKEAADSKQMKDDKDVEKLGET